MQSKTRANALQRMVVTVSGQTASGQYHFRPNRYRPNWPEQVRQIGQKRSARKPGLAQNAPREAQTHNLGVRGRDPRRNSTRRPSDKEKNKSENGAGKGKTKREILGLHPSGPHPSGKGEGQEGGVSRRGFTQRPQRSPNAQFRWSMMVATRGHNLTRRGEKRAKFGAVWRRGDPGEELRRRGEEGEGSGKRGPGKGVPMCKDFAEETVVG